jgi:hypothetical protein
MNSPVLDLGSLVERSSSTTSVSPANEPRESRCGEVSRPATPGIVARGSTGCGVSAMRAVRLTRWHLISTDVPIARGVPVPVQRSDEPLAGLLVDSAAGIDVHGHDAPRVWRAMSRAHGVPLGLSVPFLPIRYRAIYTARRTSRAAAPIGVTRSGQGRGSPPSRLAFHDARQTEQTSRIPRRPITNSWWV